MNIRRRPLLDGGRRRITVGERSTDLQEKAWQVLQILRDRAPAMVGRREIIERVWSGNVLTGEKGLNQAIWAIRSALGDDPRNPRYVRTAPRLGYKWIYEETLPGTTRRYWHTSRSAAVAAGVAAVLAASALAVQSTVGGQRTISEFSAPGSVAVSAHRVDADIHIEFANGRHGILKNENQANIGDPVLSADGAELAVVVTEEGNCRMVTVNLTNGERQDFSSCPSGSI